MDRDPHAEQQILASIRQYFAAVSAGDWEACRHRNAEHVSYFDYGEGLRPQAWYGREIHEAIDLWQQQEDMGAHMDLVIERETCHATSDYGCVALEFRFAVKIRGITLFVVPARGSGVFQRVDGEWLLVHWHGSMRVMSWSTKLKIGLLGHAGKLASKLRWPVLWQRSA